MVHLAPAQLGELVSGGVTVTVPGVGPLRLVPDYEAAGSTSRPLVDAATVARELDLTPAWVRDHGAELGGQRMGDGPRPRWRFDLDEARRAWASRQANERSQGPQPLRDKGSRRRRAATTPSGAVLLPIRQPEAEVRRAS